MTPAPVSIDPTYLADIFDAGGEGFVREVVDTFLVESAKRREALHAAVAAVDWAGASLAAHAIVSAASMLGLARVSEVARQVEHVTQEHRSPAKGVLAELDSGLEEARGLLASAISAEARRRGAAP